jgi:hypothetical protein
MKQVSEEEEKELENNLDRLLVRFQNQKNIRRAFFMHIQNSFPVFRRIARVHCVVRVVSAKGVDDPLGRDGEIVHVKIG